MKKVKKISVVIAAYNEEPRIPAVLSVVCNHPLIDEVIVIDDGSKDNTIKVAKKFDIKLIKNKQNMGKTLSVKRGIEAARNELIMLIDADLVGLCPVAIEKLAEPVLAGKVDWTLSLRKNSLGVFKLLGIDWISGERLVPRKMLLEDSIWSRPKIGYGLEVLMNKSLLKNSRTFQSVYLSDLIITNKAQKVGIIKGLKGEIKMINQISKVMPLPEFTKQLLTMAKLNRKYSK